MNASASKVQEPVLRSRRFRLEREASWLELESLLERMGSRKLPSLSADEVERLPVLYRLALSSLSVARAIALDRSLIDYLENLSLRAFLTVYKAPASIKQEVREFVLDRLPRAVRTLRWHIFTIVAILLLGLVSGFVLVSHDEGWFGALVPSDLAAGRGPLSSTGELRQVLATGLPDAEEVIATIAGALFAHNTTIGLLMFGLGPLAGIPTILLSFQQGLILGAFFGLHAHHGLGIQFAGWVSIHGVTELGALVLFGAAGLKLGEILVFPGRYSRAESYAIYGATVGVVVTGAAAMLLIAAVLEGFLRQAIIDTDVRLLVALTTLIGWVSYFYGAGRQGTEQ